MSIRLDYTNMMAPPIDGGITDAEWRDVAARFSDAHTAVANEYAGGTLGYFAVQDGSVVAVDLATGQRRWTTRHGRWPLAARAGWLAVAAPDGAQRNTLHVCFLRPADGKLIIDAPVRMPDGILVSNEGDSVDGEVVIALHNASLTLSSDVDGARLRISWLAQNWIPSGFRPSPVQKVSGVVLIDPTKGSVEHKPGVQAAAPAPALIPTPAGFKPAPTAIYWGWGRYGSAWSNKPTVFRISPTIVAFFSYENRRLILNRKLLAAHRALVLFRVRDADHPRSARRALASMLSHPNKRSEKRCQNSEQDKRNTKENPPTR